MPLFALKAKPIWAFFQSFWLHLNNIACKYQTLFRLCLVKTQVTAKVPLFPRNFALSPSFPVFSCLHIYTSDSIEMCHLSLPKEQRERDRKSEKIEGKDTELEKEWDEIKKESERESVRWKGERERE